LLAFNNNNSYYLLQYFPSIFDRRNKLVALSQDTPIHEIIKSDEENVTVSRFAAAAIVGRRCSQIINPDNNLKSAKKISQKASVALFDNKL